MCIRDSFGAAVEAAPVDFLADGAFIVAVGLGDLGRIDTGLIGDGQVCSLAERGERSSGHGREQAMDCLLYTSRCV